MYRLSAFIIAVAVLVGLIFSGGFLTADKIVPTAPAGKTSGSSNAAGVNPHSETALQAEADQELAKTDVKAAQNDVKEPVLKLPEVKRPLTPDDVALAVQQAGIDAEKTALRVGQNADQAQSAKQAAEEFVRIRMERQMREEQQALKTI